MLWPVLFVLGVGLLVAWCGPRVKPVLWFGLLFGGLTGGLGVLLERWLDAPSLRARPAFVAVSAVIGCAAVFAVAVTAAHRTTASGPQDALAEALIRSLEQTDSDGEAMASPPAALPPRTWQGTAEWWASRRYRTLPGAGTWWLFGEFVLAGLGAGALQRLLGRRGSRAASTEAAP